MTAYVLGLVDGFRGDWLIASLARYGIPARHVPAVAATALDDDGLAAIYDAPAARWIDRELAPAEAACAFGHLTMMRDFLMTGAGWGLFLEDDAVLLGDPSPLLGVLASAPRSPTVVHLGARPARSPAARLLADSADCRLWAADGPLDGTAGYLANRALARLATRAYRDHLVDSVADWPVRWRHDAQFAWCQPPLIAHEGTDSSIAGDRAAAQATGIRDRRARLGRLVRTIVGPRLISARRHGYPVGLVFRLDVLEPIARLSRRRRATRLLPVATAPGP